MSTPLTNAHVTLASLTGVDWILLFILASSIVLAFLRGMIRELFGLAGTVLGLLLAAWNYAELAAWLSRWITSPASASFVAFLMLFTLVAVVSTLLGRVVRGAAHTVGLGSLDRLAGAGFGLLRGGLLIVGLLIAITAFFPSQTILANSRLGPYFLAAAREVSFVVPQDLQKRIFAGLASLSRIATR